MFAIVWAVLIGLGIRFAIQAFIFIRKKWQYRYRSLSTYSKTKSADPLINYAAYELSKKEIMLALLASALMVFTIAYVFYKNISIALLFSLSSFYFLKIRRNHLLMRRKTELNDQFKQALFSISSSLSAGRSFENAITEAVEDLQMLYANPQTYIIIELQIIVQKIRNGENVETALKQFSDRANLEDIRNFTEVIAICKRSGGNLVEVIRRTAAMIGEKIELQQDITLLVAQKRLESRILSFAPLGIVALLSFSSPDYMLPLYEGYLGKFIMTIALGLLFLCFIVSNKIMNIQVQTK